MPKIVSRGTTVSSGNETHFTDEKVNIYYCICGAHVFSLDTRLETLPKRRTDGASVLEVDKHDYRLRVQKLEVKVLRRPAGFERQFRFGCPECNLPITYQSQDEDAQLIYFIPDSLVPKTRYDGPAISSDASEIKVDLGEGEEIVKLTDDSKPSTTTTTTTTSSSVVDMKVWPLEEQRKFLEEQIKRLESGQEMVAVVQQAQVSRVKDLGDEKEKERDSDRDRRRSRSRSRERDRDRRNRDHDRDRDRHRDRRDRSRSRSRERDNKREREKDDRDSRRNDKRDDRDQKRQRV